MQNSVLSESENIPVITPFAAALGAEISNIDLAAPLSEAQFAEVIGGFLKYHVLVFRNQPIDDEQHLAFAARFGELEGHINKSTHHEKHDKVQVFSNIKADGTTTGANPDLGTLVWHTDKSYIARPSLATVLRSPAIAAEGGDTLFANTHAGYDALDEATKQLIDSKKAVHSWAGSRLKSGARTPTTEELAAAPPVEHPITRTHPVTGRKCIYAGNHSHHIAGMAVEDGVKLLADLEAHTTQEKFIYRHKWQVNDVIMWDNRSTLHCVTYYDAAKEKRAVHRVVVTGDEPY
ncbi:MAG: alpha-ketoglutarate-dependent taurine dioxygenase [Gammaproteobacteria bacterium]|jgi:alpha-ketoglutarate-dependent taurine dioxygenase